jgi:hypothetical protein
MEKKLGNGAREGEMTFQDELNSGKFWPVEVFYDISSDSYNIAEGKDRLHRGFPIAGFESLAEAETYIAEVNNNE